MADLAVSKHCSRPRFAPPPRGENPSVKPCVNYRLPEKPVTQSVTGPAICNPFMTLKNICVYCGSNPGTRPDYIEQARVLARELVKRAWCTADRSSASWA
jgi:hypothetical protein